MAETTGQDKHEQPQSVRRVLFLVHRLNLSGVATLIQSLAKQFMASGIRCAIAARHLDEGQPLGRESFEALGIDVYEVPFPNFEMDSVGRFALTAPREVLRASKAVKSLRQVVDEFKPDVMNLHAATLYPYARLVSRNIDPSITIVTTFNIEQSQYMKRLLARVLRVFTTRPLGDRSIAVSEGIRDLIERVYHVQRESISVVYPSVDESRFWPPSEEEKADARTKAGVPDGVPAVAMLAVYEKRKRHDLLIEAVAKLHRRGVRVHAVFAGQILDEDRQRLERQLHADGIADYATFLGFVEAREAFWAADVSVLPSDEEGFGLVVVESMLSGTPAIRTPSAGHAETVEDGVTGLITPFGDAEALADRIERVINEPGLRASLVRAGLEFATMHFSSASLAQQTIDVYAQAIEERTS